MIKHNKPNGELGHDRPVLSCCPNSDASGFDKVGKFHKLRNHIASREWSVAKHNAVGNGDINLVLKGAAPSCGMVERKGDAEHLFALSYKLNNTITRNASGDFWEKNTDKVCLNFCGSPSNDEELMLVLNVKGIEFVDAIFSSRVRLRKFDLFGDIFRGFAYMSATHHRYFAFGGVDRELDVLLTRDKHLHDTPVNMIQSTADAMNSISNNVGDMWWNGYVGFDREGQIACSWIEAKAEFKRALLQIFPDANIKVVDVMTRAV